MSRKFEIDSQEEEAIAFQGSLAIKAVRGRDEEIYRSAKGGSGKGRVKAKVKRS